MAELATIARPYAEALFKAAGSALDGTAAWLDELAVISSDPELRQFAEHPKVSEQQVLDLIAGVAKTTWPDLAQQFVRTIIGNGRLAALPAIAAQFRALNNSQGGSSDALVGSAFPLDAGAVADLSSVLEKRFGRKLNVSVDVQPDLIGGIRVVVGDEVLDTSVKARLEQMKVALTS